MPGIDSWLALRRVGCLCVFVASLVHVPDLAAQVSGYAVIDGTLNPPTVVTSTVNVAIADNGTGSYTLTFDQPVVFFLGTSMTEGGAFDVAPSFLTATQDALDNRKVLVNIRYPSLNHFPVDAQFSLEVRMAQPPP
jgi:hypothetical protein